MRENIKFKVRSSDFSGATGI